MTLKNYVIDEMIDKIYDMEGRTEYGCELGYAIFESANIDGSYTYNTQESIEWIGKYFSELGPVVEDTIANIGENIFPNPFNNPEAFQVAVMLEVSSQLIAQCPSTMEHWDDGIDLTKETIETIVKELEELKD